MIRAFAFTVFLFGNEVYTQTSPILRNRVYQFNTQEQLIKNRFQTLTAFDTIRLNPNLRQLTVPKLSNLYSPPQLSVQYPSLYRLPELNRLPTVSSTPKYFPVVNTSPLFKSLPTSLIPNPQDTFLRPPRIGAPPSALESLLMSAGAKSKVSVNDLKSKSPGYNRDQVWADFKALQDRASKYLIN